MYGYYFLVNALPPLKFGDKPEIAYEEVEALVDQNVAPSDRKKVTLFKQYIDLKNLRLLWMDLPIDPRGNLNKKELEAALLIHDFFPPFVFEFIQTYEDVSQRLGNFLFLIARFLQYQIEMEKGFLHLFFRFEREFRLILTALRAKDQKKDLSIELQYEDTKDTLVQKILSEKEGASFEPPDEFREVKNLYFAHRENPKNLFFACSEFSFRKIGEMKRIDPFSIDAILAYMAGLILVEDWSLLDEERGKAIVTSLL